MVVEDLRARDASRSAANPLVLVDILGPEPERDGELVVVSQVDGCRAGDGSVLTLAIKGERAVADTAGPGSGATGLCAGNVLRHIARRVVGKLGGDVALVILGPFGEGQVEYGVIGKGVLVVKRHLAQRFTGEIEVTDAFWRALRQRVDLVIAQGIVSNDDLIQRAVEAIAPVWRAGLRHGGAAGAVVLDRAIATGEGIAGAHQRAIHVEADAAVGAIGRGDVLPLPDGQHVGRAQMDFAPGVGLVGVGVFDEQGQAVAFVREPVTGVFLRDELILIPRGRIRLDPGGQREVVGAQRLVVAEIEVIARTGVGVVEIQSLAEDAGRCRGAGDARGVVGLRRGIVVRPRAIDFFQMEYQREAAGQGEIKDCTGERVAGRNGVVGNRPIVEGDVWRGHIDADGADGGRHSIAGPVLGGDDDVVETVRPRPAEDVVDRPRTAADRGGLITAPGLLARVIEQRNFHATGEHAAARRAGVAQVGIADGAGERKCPRPVGDLTRGEPVTAVSGGGIGRGIVHIDGVGLAGGAVARRVNRAELHIVAALARERRRIEGRTPGHAGIGVGAGIDTFPGVVAIAGRFEAHQHALHGRGSIAGGDIEHGALIEPVSAPLSPPHGEGSIGAQRDRRRVAIHDNIEGGDGAIPARFCAIEVGDLLGGEGAGVDGELVEGGIPQAEIIANKRLAQGKTGVTGGRPVHLAGFHQFTIEVEVGGGSVHDDGEVIPGVVLEGHIRQGGAAPDAQIVAVALFEIDVTPVGNDLVTA